MTTIIADAARRIPLLPTARRRLTRFAWWYGDDGSLEAILVTPRPLQWAVDFGAIVLGTIQQRGEGSLVDVLAYDWFWPRWTERRMASDEVRYRITIPRKEVR